MPIYEFMCATCNCLFEEILPSNYMGAPICPQCGRRDDVRKQLSACAVRTESASSCSASSGFS